MAASTNTQRAHRYCGLCIARCGCRRRRRPVCPFRTPIPLTDRQGALRQGPRPTETRRSSEAGDPPARRTRPTGDPDGANLNLTIGTAVLDPVSGTASYRSDLREIRRSA